MLLTPFLQIGGQEHFRFPTGQTESYPVPVLCRLPTEECLGVAKYIVPSSKSTNVPTIRVPLVDMDSAH